ncbi:MAG: threonine synthase [bacterium]
MRFRSTRNSRHTVSFLEAVTRGLAPDGGLYQPVGEFSLRQALLDWSGTTSFQELAVETAKLVLSEDFSPEEIEELVGEAFPFAPKLQELTPNLYVLELFHGPSCAFKDFGASFLANVMERRLGHTGERAVILTATSGDTGSAVAEAFYGKQNVEVVILYPSGRVSPLQEMQLTGRGGNVHALEVEGSFDDCQRLVKEAFQDQEVRATLPVTSANSINVGRLLPQTFYYLYGFTRIKERRPAKLFYTVPSGNFGNLTAGVFAWSWGLPVTGFVAATNVNDTVPRYLLSGEYEPRSSVQTLSNAMDVGDPSNFERLQALFPSGWNAMRALMHGESVTDEDTLAAIRRWHDRTGVFLDPHTATGIVAAERIGATSFADLAVNIVLGTAHPAKFGDIVAKAAGTEPPMPPQLAAAMERTKQATPVSKEYSDLRGFLLDTLG